MPNGLQLVIAGVCGAALFGGIIFWNDLQHVDALRKQLAEAQSEVSRLKAVPMHPPVQERPVTSRRRPNPGVEVSESGARRDSRVAEALKGQQEAQHRLVEALEQNQKLTASEAAHSKERETLMKAHIAKLSPADRSAFVELSDKAVAHTLTWEEFRELERIAGGEFAYLALPKLREIRKEVIRHLIKENPARERELRVLEPEAFAADSQDN
jgi:hypothetical protein